MNKVQWYRAQNRNEERKKQEDEAERSAMASIDWFVFVKKSSSNNYRHDFVVVQTIEFDEEDETAIQTTRTQIQPQIPEEMLIQPKEAEEMELESEEEEMEQGVEVKVRPDFDPRARTSMYTSSFHY